MSLSARRAWIEISGPLNAACIWVSLSARRAWIEIEVPEDQYTALSESLSARRAWIEIFIRRCAQHAGNVALRKESVDRNSETMLPSWTRYGRSPQGERG